VTTTRAPHKTRRWTEIEDAELRSLVHAGKDARTIGKELQRSFMGIQSRAKRLNLNLKKKSRLVELRRKAKR
jgi:hypothetical protein